MTNVKTLSAYTPGVPMPPYINISIVDDKLRITLREEAKLLPVGYTDCGHTSVVEFDLDEVKPMFIEVARRLNEIA